MKDKVGHLSISVLSAMTKAIKLLCVFLYKKCKFKNFVF